MLPEVSCSLNAMCLLVHCLPVLYLVLYIPGIIVLLGMVVYTTLGMVLYHTLLLALSGFTPSYE